MDNILRSARLWGATNSSSLHTVMRVSGDWPENYDPAPLQYGRQDFLLTTSGSKMNYLAATCYSDLRKHMSGADASMFVQSMFQIELSELDQWGDLSVWVDHQSLIGIPLDRVTGEPNRRFIRDLTDYLLHPDIVIVGGGDESPETRMIPSGAVDDPIYSKLPGSEYASHLWAIEYPENKYWVLFNPTTGARFRIAFDPNADTSRSFYPELMDVKITDFCPFGCPYCYQSSTTSGAHADLTGLANLIASTGVIEVAIGGGEPTLHPGFWDLLKDLRTLGVSPSFTTRSNSWLNDPENCSVVFDNCAAFAVSVSHADSVERFASNLRNTNIYPRQVTIQYVLGTSSLEDLELIIESVAAHRFKIVLLGYKHYGFGEHYAPFDYSNWVQAIRSHGIWRNWFGVDTELVSQFRQELEQMGNSSLFMSIKEGTHSMYFDAVNNTVAPSSFSPQELFVSTGRNVNAILDAYRRFNV